MKKKRIIPSIAILMVLTAIMIALTGCTTSEQPTQTVQNVYIKEDDNSSDNNAETKILVELEDEGETELVILSAPNELFDKLGIGKKEKYTQATEEKVKAVLDVLVKELGLSTKTLSQFNEHTTPENSAPAVQNVYIKDLPYIEEPWWQEVIVFLAAVAGFMAISLVSLLISIKLEYL